MSKFKSLVTALGQARIASAIASGKDVNITQLAVGDGNGSATTPSTSQTALVHETYRLPLNSIKTDNKNANWIIAEAIIPASVGGFWMREMGLFSSEGELIAVSNMADSYKPTLEEGSGRTQTLRMVITVTDTDAVTLTIDDTLVIATEEYVNNLLAEHEASRRHPDGTLTNKGFVQLSSAVDSTSEVLAATPKAVKTSYDLAKSANDNANGRLPSGGTAVAANKLATARKIAGVAFDGTADISITSENIGVYNKTESDNKYFLKTGGNIGKSGVLSTGDIKTASANIISQNGGYYIQNADGVNISLISADSGGTLTLQPLVGAKIVNVSGSLTENGTHLIAQDTCNVAGFIGGDVNNPYMRHKTSNAVVSLALRNTGNLGAGWWKDVSTGLIIQWGANLNGSSNVETHNYPIAFPNAGITVVGNLGTSIDLGKVVYLMPVNSAGFASRTSGNGLGFWWIALGY
ncbi:phage tail protein [Rahnella sp. PCH160]|uniref:phage tail protein n=1 Tax=Rahnella sp. PCH160 TaxID=3447928 RepID=UPI0039FD93A2